MIQFEVSSGGADKRIYNDRNSTCSVVVYIELAYICFVHCNQYGIVSRFEQLFLAVCQFLDQKN